MTLYLFIADFFTGIGVGHRAAHEIRAIYAPNLEAAKKIATDFAERSGNSLVKVTPFPHGFRIYSTMFPGKREVE